MNKPPKNSGRAYFIISRRVQCDIMKRDNGKMRWDVWKRGGRHTEYYTLKGDNGEATVSARANGVRRRKGT